MKCDVCNKQLSKFFFFSVMHRGLCKGCMLKLRQEMDFIDFQENKLKECKNEKRL